MVSPHPHQNNYARPSVREGARKMCEAGRAGVSSLGQRIAWFLSLECTWGEIWEGIITVLTAAPDPINQFQHVSVNAPEVLAKQGEGSGDGGQNRSGGTFNGKYGFPFTCIECGAPRTAGLPRCFECQERRQKKIGGKFLPALLFVGFVLLLIIGYYLDSTDFGRVPGGLWR